MAREGESVRKRGGDSVRLAPREREIAQLRLQGMAVDGIARELGIKPSSVRTTMHRVYRKYGVDNLESLRDAAGFPGPGDQERVEISESNAAEAMPRESSVLGFAVLVARVCFSVCAASSLVYIVAFPYSAFRRDMDDVGVVFSLCGGLLLGFMLARLDGGPLSRRRPSLRRCVDVLALASSVLLLVILGLMPRHMLVGIPSSGVLSAAIVPYGCVALLSLIAARVFFSGTVPTVIEGRMQRPVVLALGISAVFLAVGASFDASLAFALFLGSGLSSFPTLAFGLLNDGSSDEAARGRDARNGAPLIVQVPFGAVVAVTFSVGMSFACAAFSHVNWLLALFQALPPLMAVMCAFTALATLHATETGALIRKIIVAVSLSCAAAVAFHSSLAGLITCLALSGTIMAFERSVRLQSSSIRWDLEWLACMGCAAGALFGAVAFRFFDSADLNAIPTNAHALLAVVEYGFFLFLALCGAFGSWTVLRLIIDASEDASALTNDVGPAAIERTRAYFTFHGFSDFEAEVALRTLTGSSISTIASELHYSAGSVKAARAKAYRLLSVHDIESYRQALTQVTAL